MAHKSSFLKNKEKNNQTKTENNPPNQLLVKHLCNCPRTQLSQYFWSLKLQGFTIRKMLTFKLFPAKLFLSYSHLQLAWRQRVQQVPVNRGSSPPVTQTFTLLLLPEGKRRDVVGDSGFSECIFIILASQDLLFLPQWPQVEQILHFEVFLQLCNPFQPL